MTDVFPVEGRVLMGAARWQREQQVVAEKKQTAADSDLKRLRLQLAQAEAAARCQIIQTEMESRRAEIDKLARATGSASELSTSNVAKLRKLRRADIEVSARSRKKPASKKLAK